MDIAMAAKTSIDKKARGPWLEETAR